MYILPLGQCPSRSNIFHHHFYSPEVNSGDPQIFLWFYDLWFPLFHDTVSEPNFVNSLPFHDFEKKRYKKMIFAKYSDFMKIT